MAAVAPLEVDLVDVITDATVRTVNLALVPRIGEQLYLDLGGQGSGEGVYRVVSVRYHLRPRMIVRTDDLFGITLYVERTI